MAVPAVPVPPAMNATLHGPDYVLHHSDTLYFYALRGRSSTVEVNTKWSNMHADSEITNLT